MPRHNFCHDKTERLRQKIQRLQTKLDEKLAEHWTESDATASSSDADLASEVSSVSLEPLVPEAASCAKTCQVTLQCEPSKCCATAVCCPPAAPQEQTSNGTATDGTNASESDSSQEGEKTCKVTLRCGNPSKCCATAVCRPPAAPQEQENDELRQFHDMNVALLYTKFAEKKDRIKQKLEKIEQKATAKADNPEAQARFVKKREKFNAKLAKLEKQLQKKLAFVERMASRKRWCAQKHQQHEPRKCFQQGRVGFLALKIQQLRLKRDYIDNRIKLHEDRISNNQDRPGFQHRHQRWCHDERNVPRFEGTEHRHNGPKCHRFQHRAHHGVGFKTITIVKSNE